MILNTYIFFDNGLLGQLACSPNAFFFFKITIIIRLLHFMCFTFKHILLSQNKYTRQIDIMMTALIF
jgi:hypothetical protein